MNKEELKKQVIKLSNELEQSDGELLDLILDKADKDTLLDTFNKLKEFSIITKLENFFNAKQNVIKTPNGYDDEFTITKDSIAKNIEVVTKAVAIKNELDFISDSQERYKFLIELAEAIDPEEIGAYKKIETNLYYREF